MYRSDETPAVPAAKRRRAGAAPDRDGFRPVALPALAAAMQAGTRMPGDTGLAPKVRASTDRFLHEDAPLV